VTNEIRLLAPTGNLGSGFLLSSLQRAKDYEPHVIACDSGSTDGGPSYLGSGKPFFPRAQYVRDLRHLLAARDEWDVPLIIGSAAGSGSDPAVDFLADVVRELVTELGIRVRVARIYASQSTAQVRSWMADGRVQPLWPSEPLDVDTVESASNIVAMMGCEPIVEAIDAGAQVVIAGRASDSALFAALPVHRGFPAGYAWHAGKILECGAAATVHRIVPDCMMAAVRHDGFDVWPLDPRMRCSPVSVAAHTLYENADPFTMREPSGTLVTTDCSYEQRDDRAVAVRGSAFEPAATYTVKLEGSALVGYHAVAISGIRDPYVIRGLDAFLDEVRQRTIDKASDVTGLSSDAYTLNFRVFGRDAVMGAFEPHTGPCHEVGVVFESIAPTQDHANTITSLARYVALHHPVPEWTGMVTNLATPYSPEVMPRGAAYRFVLNHVVAPTSPTEPFRIEHERL